jgi:hypothetical protein
LSFLGCLSYCPIRQSNTDYTKKNRKEKTRNCVHAQVTLLTWRRTHLSGPSGDRLGQAGYIAHCACAGIANWSACTTGGRAGDHLSPARPPRRCHSNDTRGEGAASIMSPNCGPIQQVEQSWPALCTLARAAWGSGRFSELARRAGRPLRSAPAGLGPCTASLTAIPVAQSERFERQAHATSKGKLQTAHGS